KYAGGSGNGPLLVLPSTTASVTPGAQISSNAATACGIGRCAATVYVMIAMVMPVGPSGSAVSARIVCTVTIATAAQVQRRPSTPASMPTASNRNCRGQASPRRLSGAIASSPASATTSSTANAAS